MMIFDFRQILFEQTVPGLCQGQLAGSCEIVFRVKLVDRRPIPVNPGMVLARVQANWNNRRVTRKQSTRDRAERIAERKSL
jgi:hypothetical protein